MVNNAPIVNIEARDLDAEALRILRAIPGVTADVAPGASADAVVRYAGTAQAVAVEFRRQVNAATAYQLVHAPRAESSLPLLVIADTATSDARGLLEDNNIGLIDGHGYAHVLLPGLVLHYEGVRVPAQVSPARLRGKAGVAAQVLLLDPERAWRVNDLAAIAGISVGLAHRVLARLEAEQLVEATGKGPGLTRTVTVPGALLDLWAEEELGQVRVSTSAYVLAQTPAQVIDRVTVGLADAGVAHAVTGAAAASLLAPFVTSIPVVEVWVPGNASTSALMAAAGASPVGSGFNVTFLTTADDTGLAFAEQRDGTWLANSIRVYGDLRRDPKRGAEQAQRLREEVLKL